MPCASISSSFSSEVLQVSRYLFFKMRSQYSRACPVLSSITAPAKTFDMPINSVGGLCWLDRVLLSYSYCWLLSLGWMLFLLLLSMQCGYLVCLALIIFCFFLFDCWKTFLGRWKCCLFFDAWTLLGDNFSFLSPRSTFLISSISTRSSIGTFLVYCLIALSNCRVASRILSAGFSGGL